MSEIFNNDPKAAKENIFTQYKVYVNVKKNVSILVHEIIPA